jgi:hypothetical protein
VKSMEMPPWYQACTSMSRPGTGISEPLCATQFSVSPARPAACSSWRAQLVVLQIEDGVRAPLVRIVRTAARAQAAAPLVGEHDFGSIVRERRRVPVGVVRIVHRIHALRMHRVFDVEQDAVAGARARGQANRRVHGDVVALVGVRRLLRPFLPCGCRRCSGRS